MILWLFNQDFPNTLYTKVFNINEYIEAINELKNSINIKSKYYDEVIDVELYPYDGDIDLWKEEFLIDINIDIKVLHEDVLKLKPKEEDYPVMLIYKNNYKDFYWISLKNKQKNTSPS